MVRHRPPRQGSYALDPVRDRYGAYPHAKETQNGGAAIVLGDTFSVTGRNRTAGSMHAGRTATTTLTWPLGEYVYHRRIAEIIRNGVSVPRPPVLDVGCGTRVVGAAELRGGDRRQSRRTGHVAMFNVGWEPVKGQSNRHE